MKILFVESDMPQEYNCSMWRCVVPSRGLLKAGIQSVVIRIEDWANRTPEATELTQEADLVFVQRNLFANVLETILYWRDKGKILIADLDDAYEYMTENTGSPSYEFWANSRMTTPDGKFQQISPKPMDQLKWGVYLCGNLSSPSKLICDDWKDYARTYWFPNYIDGSVYKRKEVYKPPGRILLGWGGSMTHQISWTGSGLTEACKQIMTEYANVDLLLLGDPRIQRFVDMPPSRKFSVGWVPASVFHVELCKFDIGLIPLYGEYDRRRSWIKSLEYTILGVPWIGTDSEPTREIQTTTGRIVANNAQSWYEALKYYVDNLTVLKQTAIENIPLGEALSIENNTGTLVDLFQKIVKDNL
jgi:glycosyltransferase involved in cell wall biosynthesis